MRAIGTFEGVSRNYQGDVLISFAIDDESIIEKLEKDRGKELVIETKKYSAKRSLNANKYFWVLCDEIAKTLRSTKEAIYSRQLSRYGVFVDLDVKREAMGLLRDKFRYIQEVIEDTLVEREMVTARCYFGSSTYTREEMARLIDGTVEDAKELGIDTWTPEEVAQVIQLWEGDK